LHLRHVQAHPPGVHFQDALADADVDRTLLRTGRSATWQALLRAVTPVTEIALGEVVFDRVVRDARFLGKLQTVGGLRFRTGREDARFGAAIAGDAHVFANEARTRIWFDAQRIHRAHVQAFRGRALQARLLVELATI